MRSELSRYQAAVADASPSVADRAFSLVRALAAVAGPELTELVEAVPPASPWARAVRGVVRGAHDDVAGIIADMEAALAEAGPGAPWAPAAWSALGRAQAQLGEVASAARAFHEAAELARAAGDRVAEGRAIASLGFLHGEHDEAAPYEVYTRRALALIGPVDDARLHAHLLCNLAGALARQGRTDEARDALDAGWPLARELDWPWGEALYLAGYGGVLCDLGKVDAGVASYRESIALLVKLGDEFQRTRHLFTMARHLYAARRFEEAAAAVQECILSARVHGYSATLAGALELSSDARAAVGDPLGALAALREHVQVQRARAAVQVQDRVRLIEYRLQADRARP